MIVKEFIEWLEALPGVIEQTSFRHELTEAAKVANEEIELNFLRQENSDGTAWTKRSYGDWPLLIHSGDMFRAATELGASGTVLRIEDDEITFGVDGNSIDYASKHGKGEGVKRREFYFLNNQAIGHVTQKLHELLAIKLTDDVLEPLR